MKRTINRFLTTSSIIALVLPILLSSCGKFTNAIAALQATEPSWQSILNCQGGGAYIDVDVNNRTNLQLVVDNESVFPFLDKMPYGVITSKMERIYQGQSPRGIFNSSDFNTFVSMNSLMTVKDAGLALKSLESTTL